MCDEDSCPFKSDDPVEALRKCQRKHCRLKTIYVGYRRRLYYNFAVSYAMWRELLKRPEAMERFFEEEYVREYIQHHRHNGDRIQEEPRRLLLLVVAYVMMAVEEEDRKRASKTATVLALFHDAEVAPEEVPAALEAQGGIERILASERRRKLAEANGDDDTSTPIRTDVREFVKAHGWDDDEVLETDVEDEDADDDEADDHGSAVDSDGDDSADDSGASDPTDEDDPEPEVAPSGEGDQDEDDPCEDDELERGEDDEDDEAGSDEPSTDGPQIDDPDFKLGMDAGDRILRQLATVRPGRFALLTVRCMEASSQRLCFKATEVRVI